MAYQTGDTILDDEYNVFATGLAAGGSTDSANLNNVWGTGQADRGYGQSTILGAVTAGSTVTATQWATLLARITSAADHQGSSITAMSSPSATDIIEIIGAISANISTIHTNRKNSAGNGTTATTNIDSTGSWSTQAQQIITLTWSDPDEARYFFNAGGYIQVNPTVTGYTDDAKARSWDALTQMAGNVQFKSDATTVNGESNSITVTEAHTASSASVSAIGYYDLTTSNQLLFDKTLTTFASPYIVNTANNIKIYVKSNGTQGSYSDNGTVITFTIDYNDASEDSTFDKSEYTDLDVMDGTVRNQISKVPPSTTYLTQSWSSPTVALSSSTHT
jgi:hypothetical protein